MHGQNWGWQVDGKTPSPLEVVALHCVVHAAHNAFLVAVHKPNSQSLHV